MLRLNPYLEFNGDCEEAMSFYRDCVGGEFDFISYYKDGPTDLGGKPTPEHMMDKIMHLTWRFESNIVQACDAIDPILSGSQVTLSINLDDEKKAVKIFNKLSSTGNIILDLQTTFWGAVFGILSDKYGIRWKINCTIKAD